MPLPLHVNIAILTCLRVATSTTRAITSEWGSSYPRASGSPRPPATAGVRIRSESVHVPHPLRTVDSHTGMPRTIGHRRGDGSLLGEMVRAQRQRLGLS